MSWLVNYQPWFSVVGLIADIIGFGMLSWEWRAAIKQAEEDDVEGALNVGAWGMDDDEKAKRKPGIQAKFAARYNPRKRWFLTGAGLIIAGFVFQLLGSLPLDFAAIDRPPAHSSVLWHASIPQFRP